MKTMMTQNLHQVQMTCVALLLAAILPSASAGATDADTSLYVPRYLFAIEDTLDLPAQFRVGPVDITGERLGIGEIVERCIKREDELRGLIEAHDYTQVVKSVFHMGGYGEDAERLLVMEDVQRVSYRKPGPPQAVLLSHEEYAIENGKRGVWDREKEPIEVAVEHSGFNDLPFYLRDKSQYDFAIISRKIIGDHVVYEVSLSPKSDFEIAPKGRIWVDTADFQILREEFDFEDRVPMPVIVKSIRPFIRERERIGDLWVWKRFLIRVDLRMNWVPILGRKAPRAVEYIVNFRDHRLNDMVTDEGRESGGEGG